METVIQDKFVRQLNLLGIVLGHPGEYDTIELALLFRCDEITVKRDLRELRSMGIDIHARKKKGISVSGTINDQLLRVLLRQYLGLTAAKNIFDPAVHMVIAKHGPKALPIFTQIQLARDNYRQISVTLKSDPTGRKKLIGPRMLYHGRDTWYLAAQSGNNSFIRISIDNIASIKVTDIPFDPFFVSSSTIFGKSVMHGFESDEIVEIHSDSRTDDELFGLDLMHIFPAEKLWDNVYRVYVSERDLEVLLLWIISRSAEISAVKPRHISQKISLLAETIAAKYRTGISAKHALR